MATIEKGKEYQCFLCLGTFTASMSDAEARAKMRREGLPAAKRSDDEVIVCLDCYAKAVARMAAEAVADAVLLARTGGERH